MLEKARPMQAEVVFLPGGGVAGALDFADRLDDLRGG